MFGFLKFIIALLPFLIIFSTLVIYGEYVQNRSILSKLEKEYKIVDTNSYRIYAPTDIDISHITDSLENFTKTFYEKYGDIIGIKAPIKKISIKLFNTHKELVNYGDKRLRRHLDFNDGFYNAVGAEIALVFDREKDLKSLYHEIIHAILDSVPTDAEWSVWLNEGLATTLSNKSARAKLDKRYITYIKDKIDEGNFIPVKKLISVSTNNFTSQNNLIYYAEAHLLTYFLLESKDGSYREKFFRYIEREADIGFVTQETFQVEMGDIERLEEEFKAFILNE